MDREELIKDIHYTEGQIKALENHPEIRGSKEKVEEWKLELKKMKIKCARYPQETKD